MKYKTAIVIAGGAFATSIAFILSHQFKKVIIKVRSDNVYRDLLNHKNDHYLPGIGLPLNIVPALTWSEVADRIEESVELIVSGLPTSAVVSFCAEHRDELNKYLAEQIPFVSLTKGIDAVSLKLPDELYFDFFQDYRDQFVFLSGPSFAKEILEQQITLVSLAGRSRSQLHYVASMMKSDYFKIFPSYDIKGVLLGGALKNVLAIAGGIVEGLGYNDNTRAALITKGIADMLRLGLVFNARPETFYGLSGMGDLILSTTGLVSRNKSFGKEVAQGGVIQELIQQKTVVEGYGTTLAVERLCERYAIRCPIFHGVYQVLYEGVDPRKVIINLMKLPIKIH